MSRAPIVTMGVWRGSARSRRADASVSSPGKMRRSEAEACECSFRSAATSCWRMPDTDYTAGALSRTTLPCGSAPKVEPVGSCYRTQHSFTLPGTTRRTFTPRTDNQQPARQRSSAARTPWALFAVRAARSRASPLLWVRRFRSSAAWPTPYWEIERPWLGSRGGRSTPDSATVIDQSDTRL